jgi:hypothetical protein
VKTGDLIFIKPYDLIGRSITFMTGEEYSHVAMAVSPTLIFEAQYGSVSKLTKIYHPNHEVVPMNLDDYKQKLLIDFIYESDVLGIQYDLNEIFGWLLQLLFSKILNKLNIDLIEDFDNPKKFICIEAILYCYREALGIELLDKPDHLVLFNDLHNNDYVLSQ